MEIFSIVRQNFSGTNLQVFLRSKNHNFIGLHHISIISICLQLWLVEETERKPPLKLKLNVVETARGTKPTHQIAPLTLKSKKLLVLKKNSLLLLLLYL